VVDQTNPALPAGLPPTNLIINTLVSLGVL
jgi:hypothetical protein